METTTQGWTAVRLATHGARGAAWDGCHKIYLAMDDIEADWFASEYEYFTSGTPDDVYTTVKGWYEDSCGLRFVSAVYHNEDDPNAGFIDLIPQFSEED
jgi:hypothetical protein